MRVFVVSYTDVKYPKEPVITAFSNEEAARTMQEHLINTRDDVKDVILDEVTVYKDYFSYD